MKQSSTKPAMSTAFGSETLRGSAPFHALAYRHVDDRNSLAALISINGANQWRIALKLIPAIQGVLNYYGKL
jgi:hypothetical protein